MSKSRTTRSGHPGVIIVSRALPSGGTSWRARWTDPDTGKQCSQSFTKLKITNAEGRRSWAIEKSDELAARARALSKGATPHSGKSIAEAFDLYFETADIKPSTASSYREGADLFLPWCERMRLLSTDDLRPAHLSAFRDVLRDMPARRPAKGKGKRGKMEQGKRLTKPSTTNNRLRALKAILRDLHRRRLLPHLHRDDLFDQLRPFKVPKGRPAFLKPSDLELLLKAVREHDAETCSLTREEKARGVKPGEGTTPKNDPGAPIVLLALLTGARLDELLALRWDQVDLDAGVIEIRAEDVKTGHGREVWLDVTPSLNRLLLGLRLKSRGPFVIGGEKPWTRSGAPKKLRRRLIDKFNAPEFTWSQRSDRTPSLRATAATYGTNAGGVWRESSAWTSAKRLGHSVAIAERHYAGRWRVPRDAENLEQAMEVADVIAELVDLATGRAKAEAG